MSALVWLASSAWAGVAWAQSSESDRFYEERLEAQRADRVGTAPETIAAMRERFAQTHEPRALGTQGLAEAVLDRCDDAEPHLLDALSMPGAWIDNNRAVLEREAARCLQRHQAGALVVRSGAAGAEVFVNGAQLGAAGRYVRAPVGRMTYELRAPGFVHARRRVRIRRGAITREQVELTPDPTATPPEPAPAPPVTPPEPAPAPPVTPPPEPAPATPPVTPPTQPPAAVEHPLPTPPPDVRPPPSPEPNGTLRTLAWVSGAGSLVLAGVGVAGYLVGDAAAARWNSSDCLPAGSTREAACGGERETAESMRAVAIAGFAGAGAFAVASAVLFAVSPRRAARSTLACGRGPGELGVACAVRF